MKKWLLKNRTQLLGAVIGGIAGLLYWHFVGCATGSCGITSDPINSTAYFALLGFLLAGTFKSTKEKDGKQEAQ